MKYQVLFSLKNNEEIFMNVVCCSCDWSFNSLTTEKQTTKFSSANLKKMLSPSCIILRIQRLEGKQC